MPLKHQASNTLNKAAAGVGCGAGGGKVSCVWYLERLPDDLFHGVAPTWKL